MERQARLYVEIPTVAVGQRHHGNARLTWNPLNVLVLGVSKTTCISGLLYLTTQGRTGDENGRTGKMQVKRVIDS